MTISPGVPLRFVSPDDLARRDAIEQVLGPIERLSPEPLQNVGFSGASFERLHVRMENGLSRSLILKRVPLGGDWVCVRTGDTTGRTAALLAAPELGEVWNVFHCPYLAYASTDGEMALLMEDVGEHLFPDERTPLSHGAEEALLGALARLHARFWDAPVLGARWLTRAEATLDILRPGDRREDAVAAPPPPIREGLSRGWPLALRRLPGTLREAMTLPAAQLPGGWRGLPRTLLHGDTKVANFGVLPSGRVTAFDWSIAGAGPPTLDLGWYLAMNATRLARSKEGVLDRYRTLVEEALGRPVPPDQWEEMVDLAVLCGARAMLWSKALALESGRPGAEEEWQWWVDRLGQCELQ